MCTSLLYQIIFCYATTLLVYIGIKDFNKECKNGSINFWGKTTYSITSFVFISLSLISLITDGAKFLDYMEGKYLMFDLFFTTPTEMWCYAILAALPLFIIIIGGGYIIFRAGIKPIKVNQMVFIPSRTTHKSHREKIEEQ